ncbi:MAG TPA: FAD-dependent oxidoreductase [Solirubrobacter sp.]|nr:FAD-dependent oxidoreductase [Solirubrobacter sp.]
MTRQTPHIVIAGGGVAAVEAVAALRALAGSLPRITLLAPEDHLTPRAASVAAPFGFGMPSALPYDAIRRHARFDLYRGTLSRVDDEAHVVFDDHGEPIEYDKLLVSVGARPQPALPGAITFTGPSDAPAVAKAVEETERLAFVLPVATGWGLPVYELAIMAALEVRSRGAEPEITVVTAEPAPLWIFGDAAGAAVAELLAERGIGLRVGARPVAVHDGALELDGAPTVTADRVIALPRLVGPATPGLPHSAQGFIPVDRHGRVPDMPDVFAAGDATTFPLKQGGLATQQADAAAETIAAELGVAVEPTPFRPVLRGLLLTGGAPLYLRSALSAGGDPEERSARRIRRKPASEVSQRALWWPPSKIAGRYLAPLLATARPPLLAASQMQDYRPGPEGADRDDALELALMLAEEDAAMGDYAQALRALDAAAALTGGVLPAEWTEKRDAWRAARETAQTPA